jgi:23S rRNA pseudouridine1911/1915/1917 synthase
LALNNGFEYREQIDRCRAGITVLEHLSRTYRHSSTEEWRKRLENGEVSLDGIKVSADVVLKPGQRLTWCRPPWEEPPVPLDYAILHLDSDVLVVAKPSGLPSIPGGGFLKHTLLALVREGYPEAAPVHRLGRSTSGLVLFARTARARSTLGEAMRRRKVTKIYRALAEGLPAHHVFTIEDAIGPVPHPLLGTVHAASSAGKPALSRVRVLERREDCSLVEVQIETGRPHQIRIHLAAAGYPLVGDPLYISGGSIHWTESGLPGDSGYSLHAERLCMRHPVTGQILDIHCPAPPKLRLRSESRDGSVG